MLKYVNTTKMEHSIFTVTQINNLASSIIKESFPNVYIRGEISDLSIQNQGWVFLTLKDNESKIRCVDFSGILYAQKDKFKEGLDIIINGTLSIFEKRGEYQLISKGIEIIGSGDIFQLIENLKIKLQNKGYFEKDRKKAPVKFPSNIAVITSLEDKSMAYKDFIKTFTKRFPITTIHLYHSKMQGENSENEIINGIQYFEKKKNIEAIVLTRGGGSVEDLMTFNSERLADTIYRSKKVIVSAIGHEGNISISDLVADIHAFTPTHAAILLSPDKSDVLAQMKNEFNKYLNNIQNSIENKYINTNNGLLQIKDILNLFVTKKLQILNDGMYFLKDKMNIISNTQNILFQRFDTQERIILQNSKNMKKDINNKLTQINIQNPYNILSRGYSITYKRGTIVKSTNDIKVGDNLKTIFSQGITISKVSKVKQNI